MKQHRKDMLSLFLIKLFLKLGILGWLMLHSNIAAAQTTNKVLREGNNFYKKEKFNNATESYSKALQLAPKDVRANFNQGDALFKLNQLEKAQEHYATVAKLTKNSEIQAKAFYNIGNAYYKQEKYEESAKAYKTSLKLNPKDKEAKYNLLMALAKLKQNGGGKNNQKNKDQKEKKDNKKQDQNQQQQQSGQNEQSTPKNQQGQQQQQSSKQEQVGLSNEEAEKLLDAVENEENKVQQKLTKEKGKPGNIKVQKDW
jgi:tetratricopeptide (TPR) repeat protein